MATKKEVQRRARADEVTSYLRAQYVRMIVPNAEEGGYLAEVLELPGCVTDGDTPEEAYRNLDEAMAGWIKASLDTNRPIPDPVGSRAYSGHFPLRMSTELHRVAALRAMQEGVSLNQWIAGAIAEKVAKNDLAEELAEKIAGRVADRIGLSDDELRGRVDLLDVRATSYQFVRTRVEPSVKHQDVEATSLETVLASLAGTSQDTSCERILAEPTSIPSLKDMMMGHWRHSRKGVNRNA